ncbi:MAG: hypothetical protein JO242_00790, partial [Streptosporangiaceae bacterium]|nr:hypothetical protein [Streptosporangiaceae bacterium]
MAPPIPGLRPPVQVPRRTAGDIILGILAIITLTALTIGVPIALVTVLGVPIPHKMPSTGAFTHQLDVMSILKILSVVVWLAWLQLVWCVIVEIRAAVRNVGVPGRVPLAGATQSAAHRLVTAALLLFAATAALSPAFSHGGPPRAAHSISAQPQGAGGGQYVASAGQPQQAVMPATAHASPTAQKIYVVRPPAGRYHESLWEIAQNHLGNGRRYMEIFELNKDHVQPDGSRLTIASLIRPGWILRMPSDAYGPGVETVAHHPAHGTERSPGSRDGYASTGAGPVTGIGMPAGGNDASVRNNQSVAAPGPQQHSSPAWPYELS